MILNAISCERFSPLAKNDTFCFVSTGPLVTQKTLTNPGLACSCIITFPASNASHHLLTFGYHIDVIEPQMW